MIDYILIASLLFISRIVTVPPIVVLLYAIYQRLHRNRPLHGWFLFWGIVSVTLNVALQWFPFSVWLHMFLFACWTTSVIMCVFAGIKNVEDTAMAAALEVLEKRQSKEPPQEESEEVAAIRARICSLVSSNLAAVRGEEIGDSTVPMKTVEEGSDER